MRLRNIKRAKNIIEESNFVLKNKDDLENFLKEEKTVFLEIGMGKGSFIIEHSLSHPENNYIGIEKYASVTLRAVEKVMKLNEEGIQIPNLKFLCLDAGFLTEYFNEKSIEGIYLNFSDPWPKNRQAHRRLTSDFYLKLYKKILKPRGFIEQKTDNSLLFDYSVEQYDKNGFQTDYISYDLYSESELLEGNIATEYEQKFHSLGNKIFKTRVMNP